MKNFILLFTLFFSCQIFSQEITGDYYIETEQLAEFPDGGIGNFRKLVEDNFRLYKIKTSEDIACEVTFIIERDGSISNIKATSAERRFNREAVRAISQVKTKWKPGTINGQPVRSRFRLPLTMSFE